MMKEKIITKYAVLIKDNNVYPILSGYIYYDEDVVIVEFDTEEDMNNYINSYGE